MPRRCNMTKATTKGQKKQAGKRAPAKATAGNRSNPAVQNAPRRMSALDAAAKVLADSGTPMNCHEMIAAMAEKKLWTSPGGKTPHATLYSAILRELNTKGKEAR